MDKTTWKQYPSGTGRRHFRSVTIASTDNNLWDNCEWKFSGKWLNQLGLSILNLSKRKAASLQI